MPQHPTPSFRDLIANLRAAGGPLNAVRGLIANTRIKIAPQTRGSCCGNYGDPGC